MQSEIRTSTRFATPHDVPALVAVWTNTSARNRRVQILLKRAGFSPLEGFEVPGLKEQRYFKREKDGVTSH